MTPDDDVALAEPDTAATETPAAPADTKAAPAAVPGKVAKAAPAVPGKAVAGKAQDEAGEAADDDQSGRTLMDGVADEAETVDDAAEALKETAGKFPDDWREQLAAGDATRLKALKRFGSYKSFVNSWFQQREIITKGKQDAPLPEDASDEDKAAWRKAHDVPDDPSGYTIEPPKGIEWDAEDKKHIDAYAKFAIENGLSRAEVKRNAEWFINEQVAKLQDAAVEMRKSIGLAKRELTQEYGRELNGLLNRAQRFGRAELGQEDWDKLEFTKLANGTTLGDNPVFIRGMISMSEKYYESTGQFEDGGSGAGEVSDASFKARHLELVAKRTAGGPDAKEAKKLLADPAHEKRITAIYEREASATNRKQASN